MLAFPLLFNLYFSSTPKLCLLDGAGLRPIRYTFHTDCGVQGMDGEAMLKKLEARGIPREHMDIVEGSGINLKEWLGALPLQKNP